MPISNPNLSTSSGAAVQWDSAQALKLFGAIKSNDMDTVAAIAGALLGARWGASAIPEEWQRIVHGWPHHRAPDLIRLALQTTGHPASG